MHLIKLNCKSCNGEMQIEVNKDDKYLLCPYCGAKHYVDESDKVKIAKIYNDRIRDVDYNRQQTKKDLKRMEYNHELDKTRNESRDTLAVVLAGLGLVLVVTLGCFIFVYFFNS